MTLSWKKSNKFRIFRSIRTYNVYRYGKYNGIMNFELTYSSSPTINKNLIQICQEYRNKGQNPYIVFLKM